MSCYAYLALYLSISPPLATVYTLNPSLILDGKSALIMAPTVPSAKLTLSCPLFAADFDPRNHGFLIVAGGGGEGRSGVGNKIASTALSVCLSLETRSIIISQTRKV
jgi:hypothetical protein